MAKPVTPLTDKKIKATKPTDKVRTLSDGGNLQLRIRPNGSKTWIFKYRKPELVDGKTVRTNLSFGSYPTVTLAEARKRRDEAKELLAHGIDPKQHREAQAIAEEQKTTHLLKNVAASWLEVKRQTVTPKTAQDNFRSLERHVFPSLGDVNIGDITAPQAIAALKPLEAEGALEQVTRVCQRLNDVMTFAVNTGIIEHNRLAGMKAAFVKPKKVNMPTIKPEQLGDFMHDLNYTNIRLVTRYLIEWQLHTMVRPGEAAQARWCEIDLDAGLWHVPAETMKKKIAHTVPLSKQALKLLERVKNISGHKEFVFPADRIPDAHTNVQTANAAIKRMNGGKYKGVLVAHGFRSIASTALNDCGLFAPDLIEKGLAHLEKNEVRRAYNRGDYLERRKEMMQWWSDFIDNSIK